MLSLVVQRCAELLAEAPDPILTAQRIGARQPSVSQDLPTVVIRVEVDPPRIGSIGRALRLDEQLRDVQTGDVYCGILSLDLWATSSNELEALATKVQRRLHVPMAMARHRGILRTSPATLEPAEPVVLQPPSASPIAAWRQRLSYRFACEVEEVVTPSEGGPIRRIDVNATGVGESFSVTESVRGAHG
jgi:hypothetical protein